jgi:polyhydroxybutyrate depolymerase
MLPLVLLLAAEPEMLKPGDYTRSVTMGEQKRSYLLHVPKGYDVKKPTPVVLVLHGAATNGLMTKIYCGLDRKADEASFIVVYPNGTGTGTFLTWNAMGQRGFMGNTADDVGFISKLLDDLAEVVNVDRKRVYATGISNGGMMSYRLAAELSDRIAAIAPVAGALAVNKPQTKRPVSVLHFHGTEDRLVPYKTSALRAMTLFKGAEDSVLAFAKLNGCKEEAETKEISDGKKDGLKVTRKTFAGGKEGTEAILYTIEGGGHVWPGARFDAPFLGKTARSISANDLMWEFFQKHPMK